MSRSVRWAVAGAGALCMACGDDLVVPDEGAPRSITIVQGATQNGTAGQPLPVELVVEIKDEVGRPIAQQPLTISLNDGGAIEPAQPVTNSAGRATFRWILGPVAGPQELSVAAASDGPAVTFHGTAAPATANVARPVSGNGQTGQAGKALPDSLTLQVVDEFGNPVEGAAVTWTTSDGSVSPTSGVTNSSGRVRTRWTLGPNAGSQAVLATVAGIADPVPFSATATPGPTPILVMNRQPSPMARSGKELMRQPRVQLQDGEGHNLSTSGVEVSATLLGGSATLHGTTRVTTAGNGRADFTDLRISGAPGRYVLLFSASGFASEESDSITVQPAEPSADKSSLEVSAESVTAGQGVTLTATIRDADGAPVEGVMVTFAVSGSGQTVQQPGEPTGPNGVATGAVTPTRSGERTISAEAERVKLHETHTLLVTPGPVAAAQTDAEIDLRPALAFSRVTIRTRDEFGNELTEGGLRGRLKVTVSGANSATPPITDNGDGTYLASFLRLLPGEMTIAVTLDGEPVKGSPYTVGH